MGPVGEDSIGSNRGCQRRWNSFDTGGPGPFMRAQPPRLYVGGRRTQMPRRKPTIPGTLKRSEPHAREVWEKTLESAMDTYNEEEAAYRVAYAALKHQYKKDDDHWVPKERWGP